MCGTELAYGAKRAYAMCGTKIAYGATSALAPAAAGKPRYLPTPYAYAICPAICLCYLPTLSSYTISLYYPPLPST
eukprot:1865607-Rhodomonas_salina.2